MRHDGLFPHVRCGGGQTEQQMPQQADQAGQENQDAEIEILCVKHTLLAVSRAAVHRVKLGAKKEIDGFKMNMNTAADR